MRTSRCKHFGVHETVPRHTCGSVCDFERPENIRADYLFWLNFEQEQGYKEGVFSYEAKERLEFAEKHREAIDKSRAG